MCVSVCVRVRVRVQCLLLGWPAGEEETIEDSFGFRSVLNTLVTE